MNYYDLISLILTQLHERINSDEFLERFRRPNSFVRYRKLTLKQVVAYLIHSKKRSMDIELSDLQRQLPDIDFPDVSRQAVSKARKGILPDLFKELLDKQVEMVYTHLDCPKNWFGYRVFAVDGSTLEIPLSNDTFAEFGAITSCNNHDVFWVEGLLSTIYDVFLDQIIDGQIYTKAAGERDPAREHWTRLQELNLADNALLIFDRGYYSKELYEDLVSNGCNVLMRLRKDNKFCKLGSDDFSWTATSVNGKPILYRVVKVPLPQKSKEANEYLVTNIINPSISPSLLYNLYFERWNIETKYRELKDWWELEEFTGTSCNSIEQELYINLLFSNIAALVKTEADNIVREKAFVKNKWAYQAKRTFIIGEVKALMPKFLFMSVEILPVIMNLIIKASKKRSQIHPGRCYERSKKNKDQKTPSHKTHVSKHAYKIYPLFTTQQQIRQHVSILDSSTDALSDSLPKQVLYSLQSPGQVSLALHRNRQQTENLVYLMHNQAHFSQHYNVCRYSVPE